MVFGELPFPASRYNSPELLETAVTATAPWECEHTCKDAFLLELLGGMLTKPPAERWSLDDVRAAEWCARTVHEEEAHGGCPRTAWRRIAVSRREARQSVLKGKVSTFSSPQPTLPPLTTSMWPNRASADQRGAGAMDQGAGSGAKGTERTVPSKRSVLVLITSRARMRANKAAPPSQSGVIHAKRRAASTNGGFWCCIRNSELPVETDRDAGGDHSSVA